jgi:hypothetical protein
VETKKVFCMGEKLSLRKIPFQAFPLSSLFLQNGRLSASDRAPCTAPSLESRRCMASRVTGLGEFSALGRLFSLGTFLKTTEGAQILWLLFSTGEVMY